MSSEERAKDLGVKFTKQESGYLNLCVRSGNLLTASSHTSTATGILEDGVFVEEEAIFEIIEE